MQSNLNGEYRPPNCISGPSNQAETHGTQLKRREETFKKPKQKAVNQGLLSPWPELTPTTHISLAWGYVEGTFSDRRIAYTVLYGEIKAGAWKQTLDKFMEKSR